MNITLIKADGTEFPVEGAIRCFEDVRIMLGAYIEPFTLRNGDLLLMDEEGKLKDLPFNQKATSLAMSRLFPGDFVAGDVIRVKAEDVRTFWTDMEARR